MQGNSKVPIPTLTRLATYYGVLSEAERQGLKYMKSAHIEMLCGIAATQVRKDLGHFGELGKQGVGYDVATLKNHIAAILKVDRPQRVVVIGAGRLGQALAAYPGLAEYSFEVVGLFDTDTQKIGSRVGGLTIEGADTMRLRLPSLRAKIAALAVPAKEAQNAANAAIAGGAKWLLNFTPAHIKCPDGCVVRDVSFTQEFAVLSHFIDE